jgi:2-phospho-L-lactate guanylyltransferase
VNCPADKRKPPIWAILPVKRIGSAKQRLRDALSAAERKELFRNMLADVMSAISQSGSLAGLLVVTQDPEAQALAKSYRARILVTDADEGQSAAVTAAAIMLSREGVRNIITLPSDVPLMTATDIDTVCNSLAAAPAMTIVPNSDDTGSNSIACSPPCAIPCGFGEKSFARHLLAADRYGVQSQILRLAGLALDIDVGSDLVELLRHDVATATQRYLLSSGIAGRLGHQVFKAKATRVTTTNEQAVK